MRVLATRALTIDRGVQIRAWSELILGICQRDIGHHLISFLAPSTASYIHPCSTRKKHPSAKGQSDYRGSLIVLWHSDVSSLCYTDECRKQSTAPETKLNDDRYR